MTKRFFALDEDFDSKIKNALPDKDIKAINFISTGWTNIVYEVETDDGNYFFRFPRDDFWTRTIVKDYEFASFINGKTKYNTVNLKLFHDVDRPYSVHKKFEGKALTEKMNELDSENVNKVAHQIAEFMYELHSLDYKDEKIFDTDNIGLNLVDFLDELINIHMDEDSKVFWKYEDLNKKEKNCLVHGDLNPGNIIIDENNNVAAVIDFGFAGYGNKYDDIARIIGRLPYNFQEPIIRNYEGISGEKLDRAQLGDAIDTWTHIDNGYIKYMRKIGIYD